jgi:hypothetical protein
MVAGTGVLAVRRPALLARIAGTVLVPQLVLDRLVNGEGIVGARYFLALFPFLALLAAAPLGALAIPERWAARPEVPRATAIAAVLGVLAVLAAGLPLFSHRYTYQAEYAFLRRELAEQPGPCRVSHLMVHGDRHFERDPDCCLEPERSLLELAVPEARFEPLPLDAERGRLRDSGEACQLYYHSAICSYGPTRESERRNPGVHAILRERCDALAQDPRLELLAEERVPAAATWVLFGTDEVPIRLYRLRSTAPR